MMSKFPVGSQIDHILRLTQPDEMHDLLEKTLIQPIDDLYGRPGKKIRNQIVEMSFLLAGTNDFPMELSEREKELCNTCGEVLEALHSGSLVVDDIQDGSKVRRGEPTLHLRYGLPVALNAGTVDVSTLP